MKRDKSFAVANFRATCYLVILKGKEDIFPESKPSQLQDFFCWNRLC